MRISEKLLVQRVDDQLVLMDESAGAEVVFDGYEVTSLVAAIAMLWRENNGHGSPKVEQDWGVVLRDSGEVMSRDDERDARWFRDMVLGVGDDAFLATRVAVSTGWQEVP